MNTYKFAENMDNHNNRCTKKYSNTINNSVKNIIFPLKVNF